MIQFKFNFLALAPGHQSLHAWRTSLPSVSMA